MALSPFSCAVRFPNPGHTFPTSDVSEYEAELDARPELSGPASSTDGQIRAEEWADSPSIELRKCCAWRKQRCWATLTACAAMTADASA